MTPVTAATRTEPAAAGLALRTAGIAARPTALVDLDDVAPLAWEALAARAAEPNAFFDHAFARAVNASAKGRTGARALVAYADGTRSRLIGLMPVVSARRALGLPIPALVAWQAYAPLTTPLLDREAAGEAAAALLDAAAAAGQRLLVLSRFATGGAVEAAFTGALARRGLAPTMLERHERAVLAATGDAEAYLKAALGAKKLKELRRQRHRLEDEGSLAFEIAGTPRAVAVALEGFLTLEAQGWKGQRGTALVQDAGDAEFIRTAAIELAARGRFEVVTLTRGGTAIASGLVLKRQDRAFFFKIAIDETLGRMSPGVQLTLDLTRHLFADPAIAHVDSTADADHPMIDHIWRERLAIADLVLPTRPGDPLAPALIGLIKGRRALRERAKRIVHKIRAIRENRA